VTVPPSLNKSGKTDGALSLDHLFDDLKQYIKAEIAEDAKKKLPTVKNPGSWNSDVDGGLSAMEDLASPA
jgi:hypothetical protein